MSTADETPASFSIGSTVPEITPRPPYRTVFSADLQTRGRLRGLSVIDKDNFAEIIGRSRPVCAVALKAPFGSGPDWEFEITVDSIRGLEPDQLLQHIPHARARLNLWQLLRDRRLGRATEADLAGAVDAAISADASLSWLRAPATTSAAAPGEAAPPAAGSILDLVDSPDQARRVAADIERLAAETQTRSARLGAAEAAQLDVSLRRLHLELSTIADAVLKHPEVRRLEVAWRGLKLLVDRMDFRAGVQLAVLDIPREQLAAKLDAELIQPAFNGEIPTPGLILLDYPVENTPVDMALLDEVGRLVAGLPVPAVFPVEPSFFGVKSANLIKNLPNLAGLVDGWQFAKWRALREQPYSRWLVGVLGRFVLRPPHELEPKADYFTFSEKAAAAADLLWAGGHLAMGMCAARAFAAHGWPTRMFGAEAGKLADLPVVPNPADAQRPWGPGDTTLPDRRLDEIPAVGFNLLHSVPGTDRCMLLGGVTVARPVVTADVGKQQALLEVSLPYQQFSSLTGAWLCEQPAKLHGLPAEDIQMRLLLGLRDLLGLTPQDPEDAVAIGVGPAPGDPTRRQVQVRITPPGRLVPGGLHVDFGFTVSA